jgi:hypothetical protein
MDDFGMTAHVGGDPVPDQLRSLFNNPDDARVQQLPCVLPGLDSLAVHFGAGVRTVPHQHRMGQHLVFVDGVGVVADEGGVHVVPNRRCRQQPARRLALARCHSRYGGDTRDVRGSR